MYGYVPANTPIHKYKYTVLSSLKSKYITYFGV